MMTGETRKRMCSPDSGRSRTGTRSARNVPGSVYRNRPLDRSTPDARCLDRQALRSPRQEQFKVGQFRRACGRHLGANAEETCAQTALQRTQRLPLESVRGKVVAVALAYGFGQKPLAPALLVA